MAENISSNVLFHFTNSIDRLKNILKIGFCPRYCLEYSLEQDDLDAVSRKCPPTHATPMVCFCDLPLSLIWNHLEEYGHFGIGMEKQWGLDRGLSPVTYTHLRASAREPMLRL